MISFKTINDVLDFAIEAEQKAVDFYTELSEQASNTAIKQAFIEFAGEEKGHKAKLQRFKDSGKVTISDEKVMDLKIGDYVVDVEASPNMSFQEMLVVAMKREKAAFRLYTNLSYLATNDEVKGIFNSLAQEEAKHKLRFETEYDDIVLSEN